MVLHWLKIAEAHVHFPDQGRNVEGSKNGYLWLAIRFTPYSFGAIIR